MNVYLLIEELEQNDFTDEGGYTASPMSSVVGVYETRDKAEREKEIWDQKASEDTEKFNCDNCSYIIEERPIL